MKLSNKIYLEACKLERKTFKRIVGYNETLLNAIPDLTKFTELTLQERMVLKLYLQIDVTESAPYFECDPKSDEFLVMHTMYRIFRDVMDEYYHVQLKKDGEYQHKIYHEKDTEEYKAHCLELRDSYKRKIDAIVEKTMQQYIK